MPVVVTEEEPERNGETLAGFVEPGMPVFREPTFGLARTPEILDAVTTTNRNTAVLVGLKTDVCVYKSAAGLRVSVVEDATGSPGEMHARGLTRLRDAGAALTYCCKALGYKWVRTVEGEKVVPRPARFPL